MRLPHLIPDLVFASTIRYDINPERVKLCGTRENPKVHNLTAETVYSRIGEKFSDATVFAARAHAAFDFEDVGNAASTNELLLSPYRQRLMLQFGKTDRVFDQEHPESAAVLNEMLSSYDYDAMSENRSAARISESDSRGNDMLQAADFCAGFASEIMMNAVNDRERELRRHFRKVIFNGATR